MDQPRRVSSDVSLSHNRAHVPRFRSAMRDNSPEFEHAIPSILPGRRVYDVSDLPFRRALIAEIVQYGCGRTFDVLVHAVPPDPVRSPIL